jgi:hypothetical protein
LYINRLLIKEGYEPSLFFYEEVSNMSYAHKGEILPLVNQMIPIDKETTFHASYDYHLNGMNQGEIIEPQITYSSFFDGSTGYIDCGNSPLLNPSSEITLECWYMSNKAFSVSHRPHIIGGHYKYYLIIETDGRAKMHIYDTAWRSISGTTVLTVGKWYHIAGTYDGKNVKIYVNGVLEGTLANTAALVQTANKTRIGYGYAGAETGTQSSQWVSGNLSNVRIWSRGLSLDEINYYKDREIIEEANGLIGYWKLKEKEGAVAYDSSSYSTEGIRIGGIAPSDGINFATLKKEEGKFRGAVLIEPDTTNLLPENAQNDFSNWVSDGTHIDTGKKVISPSGEQVKVWSVADEGYLYYDPTLTIGQGYTASVYVYPNKDYTFRFRFGTGNSQDDAFTSRTLALANQWTRVVVPVTSITGVRALMGYRNTDGADNVATGFEVAYAMAQIENRNGATSYLKNSRPLGKLWYPKELINPSAFTISCWFKIPYMHRVATNNAGISGSWHDPIIELAPIVNSGGWTGTGIVVGPEPAAYSRKAGLYINGSYNQVGGIAIQDNTWYHAALTYDGATLKLYIDGIKQNEIVKAMGTITDNHVLMVGGGYMGKAFTMIDELRIESRAISEDEVTAWAASGLHYNYLDYSHYVD